MAWRNILDIPGIAGVGDANGYNGGNPNFSIVGSVLVFENAGGDQASWYDVEVDLGNLDEIIQKPCNIRCTATYALVDPDDEYFVVSAGDSSAPPNPNIAGNSGEYTATGAVGALESFFARANGFDTSGPVQSLSLVIEIDGEDTTSEWTPVAKIPGVILRARYADSVGLPPYDAPDGTLAVEGVDYSLDTSTGIVTILRAGTTQLGFTFEDASGVIAGAPEYPAIQARLTATVVEPCDFRWMLNAGDSIFTSEYLDTTPHVYTGLIYDGTYFRVAVGSDGSDTHPPVGATFLLEFLLTLPSSDFWTAFVGSAENVDLNIFEKNYERYIDPGQEGQSFIPPSHSCVPVVPDGPPGGGDPPGGGGSNPGGSGDGGDTTISCVVVPLNLPGDTGPPRCVRVCTITSPSGSQVTTEPWECP